MMLRVQKQQLFTALILIHSARNLGYWIGEIPPAESRRGGEGGRNDWMKELCSEVNVGGDWEMMSVC